MRDLLLIIGLGGVVVSFGLFGYWLGLVVDPPKPKFAQGGLMGNPVYNITISNSDTSATLAKEVAAKINKPKE
jgi:hypothetical protein